MALIKANNNTLSAVTELPTGISGQNYPGFVAYKTGNQSLSSNTTTKITFDAEQLDNGSVYDTSNSRFTPGVPGYYFIGAFWRYDTGTNTNGNQWRLHKNGTNINLKLGIIDLSDGYHYNFITYADADDYFEMYGVSKTACNVNGASGYQSNASQSQFYAFRIGD